MVEEFGARPKQDLAVVRRLEAVGFRAWPAATSQYDGSWLIRLTAGHASKRLNSINPLDPSDFADLDVRLQRAAKRFSDYGRPLTLRQSPLTPPPLVDFMKGDGWEPFGESIVMTADLSMVPERVGGMDHLPIRDIGRFVDARIGIEGDSENAKPGLTEIINAIRPETGLFLFEEPGFGPAAVSLVVQDNDLAGILQVSVAPALRRRGTGGAIVDASLRWARLRGARLAWLQVEADNAPALGLYRGFGFDEVYRYVYWRKGA